jgi:hypothetical protein
MLSIETLDLAFLCFFLPLLLFLLGILLDVGLELRNPKWPSVADEGETQNTLTPPE